MSDRLADLRFDEGLALLALLLAAAAIALLLQRRRRRRRSRPIQMRLKTSRPPPEERPEP